MELHLSFWFEESKKAPANKPNKWSVIGNSCCFTSVQQTRSLSQQVTFYIDTKEIRVYPIIWRKGVGLNFFFVINSLPVTSHSQIPNSSLANSCYDESVACGTAPWCHATELQLMRVLKALLHQNHTRKSKRGSLHFLFSIFLFSSSDNCP